MTPEKIFQTFYSKTDLKIEYFFSLINHDPTSIQKNYQIIKAGKYSKWIINVYAKILLIKYDTDQYNEDVRILFENLEKMQEYLLVFDRNKKKLPEEKRDIFKFKNLSQLYTSIKHFMIMFENFNIFSLIEENIDYINHGIFNDYNIFQPLNQKGASILGVNTEWCTAYGKYSLDKKHQKKTNQYENYKKGSLYILINKNNNNDKYQFYFNGHFNYLMDKNDKNIKNIKIFIGIIFYINKKIKSINNLILIINNIKKYINIYDYFDDSNNIYEYINNQYNVFNTIILSDKLYNIINNSSFNDIITILNKYNINNSIKKAIVSNIKNISEIDIAQLKIFINNIDNEVLHTLIFKIKKFNMFINVPNDIKLSIYNKYKGFRGIKYEIN